MSFARLWALALLLLPFAWIAWEWRRQVRHAALLLKVATMVLIILALAEPVLTTRSRKVGLAVLVDTSASITDADLQRENNLLTQIAGSSGSNQIEIIPFGRNPRVVTRAESNGGKLVRTSGVEGRATNLEAPLRQALASLPAGMIHRIVLMTDGNENSGAVTRAVYQAAQVGVPVDTIALAGRAQPRIQTQAVSLPGTVFTGEKFPVDLTVYSPRAVPSATVELAAEGKTIGTHQVPLQQGENRIRIRTTLNTAGAIDLSGKILAEGLGESRFEDAVAVRSPKVTWVSGDPTGTEEHIATVLKSNKFDFAQVKRLPDSLDDTQLLVFNNSDVDGMSEFDKQRVENFVRAGGGALWIAGENNIYRERKDKPEDAIERTFPAKLAPPRSPEGTAVVVIVDKSSSMEGRKIELARSAASGVVQNLKPDDHIGILMFDNSFQWATPIRLANDIPAILRQIAGIVPDGGTQIAPALAEAYKKILPVPATYRHVVLLTDGISEEGDSLNLSREAANSKVTISTVGLGQDVNRAYLEKVAELAKGKSYFLSDPSGLEQIVLKDVKEHTGTTAIEKGAIQTSVKHPSDLLEKVDMEHVPELAGYVRFDLKPTADGILMVDEKDPLLARWQYGLGRATVFTSDAKSRWAAKWVTWDGFDRLWTNIFRDLLPRGNESEATARYDSANEELMVEYRLSGHASEPASLPDIFVLGPGEFRRAVEVTRVSPGVYRGHVRIGVQEGLFRIRPLNESRLFPEVGLYRQESELADFGSNETLLKSIAQSTGGRFNPPVAQLFESGDKFTESSMRLWPGLLALAVLLNLIELGLRKWRGIAEGFLQKKADERLAA